MNCLRFATPAEANWRPEARRGTFFNSGDLDQVLAGVVNSGRFWQVLAGLGMFWHERRGKKRSEPEASAKNNKKNENDTRKKRSDPEASSKNKKNARRRHAQNARHPEKSKKETRGVRAWRV